MFAREWCLEVVRPFVRSVGQIMIIRFSDFNLTQVYDVETELPHGLLYKGPDLTSCTVL